jgi:hypothetical protein
MVFAARNSGTEPPIVSRLLSSTSVSVHYILPSNHPTVYTVLLTTSLRNDNFLHNLKLHEHGTNAVYAFISRQ